MKKRCTRCRMEKPLEEFGRRKAMRDGHRSECKRCCADDTIRRNALLTNDERRAKNKAEYDRYRDQKIANAKAYKLAHPERARANDLRAKRLYWKTALLVALRGRAKRSGLAFDLDEEFLQALFDQQQGRCYWLGLPIAASLEHRDPLRPSVDRLDNAKGYTRDNVVLTSQFANMGRSSMTVGQMRSFVTKLRAYYAT